MNLKLIFPLVSLAFALGLVSCSDYCRPSECGETSVRLKISSGTGGIGVTRAFNGDDYALEGEFINTLCVFLADADGQIEAKFQPDLSDDESAKLGNLASWNSPVTTTAGNKSVYAFANWETAASDEWNALIAKQEGDYISEADITFMVGDLNSLIDIPNGKYIPMSGKTTVYVSEKGTDISVNLVRLVAKITFDLQIVNTWEDVPNAEYHAEYFAENPCRLYYVWMDFVAERVSLFQDLMPEGAYDELNFDIEPVLDLSDKSVYVGADPENVGYIYINESDLRDFLYNMWGGTWGEMGGSDIEWGIDFMASLWNDIYIWNIDFCNIYGYEPPWQDTHSGYFWTDNIQRNYVFPTTSIIPVGWTEGGGGDVDFASIKGVTTRKGAEK
ncbi:MAG: hypothetical protein LUD72_11850 [Bacteroidales bacterium]|nr:hypothetical protein [Bacteroidales bacterium]